MGLIDTHCHLTADRFNTDQANVIERIRDAGIERAITIGTGVADGRACQALAAAEADLLSWTCGIDPFSTHAAGDGFSEQLSELEELLTDSNAVALGEIGLDYHYDLDPHPVQQARFAEQLELAAKLDLPVVIHVRDAHADMAKVLAEHPANRGVIHSFTGTPADADPYLALGWYLSFNGIATFKNAPEVRDTAALCPADKILIETDSPYLAPVPLRGKRCEPAFVKHTLACLAEVRSTDVDSLGALTTTNARALFRLPS